ncbi:MAG: hypothetical protein H7Z13_16250 [Ferruginibacter sp.]|nr:hypothetical protein [Ferruginibacter sp.]
MKYVLLFFAVIFLYSCWEPFKKNYPNQAPLQKVWGSKPVYAAENIAKQIIYTAQKQPLKKAGNIYAFGKFIFQIDVGRGIHVIDNADPAKADRIGFITVNGCEQISIRGAYLYANSFADLVTLDIANPANLREVSRIPNAFPQFRFNYPFVQPEEKGYFTCPRTDSVVIGWVKDSIYSDCYKN